MALNKYAVLDTNGVVLNVFAMDETAVDTFWPGYGSKMVLIGPVPPDPPAATAEPRPVDFGLIKDVVPNISISVGDTVDMKTGAVTPQVIDAAPVDVTPLAQGAVTP